MTSLQEVYNLSISQENQLKAREYLSSRCIKGFDNFKQTGYLLHHKFFKQQIRDSVVFPICNSVGEIIMLDCRGVNEKSFNKLVTEKCSESFIFNIENALSNLDYVIVTESIIDAMSVLQYGYNAVSVLSASVQPRTLHMLSVFKKIIFAFDSDDAGVSASNNAREFFELHYPSIDLRFLDFYEKDLNDVLCVCGTTHLRGLIDFELD